ncbi:MULTISPECIES: MATE family efflux transporter [Thermotoga]|jgi:MATE family multidrug resistance protein|nr:MULTISPECIES: MATE family efflux transporter [Thermotoga]AJG39965.1 multidrug transporter MatE [Thermotoga sp. RQ7]MDK2785379.1 multidrug resistance protein family [Thermotoga sp.]MDK2949702.1 multidrug resistance protein family [Thermotoga sp.]HBF10652.1 MATE family efflux transporter [Thermotoga neapolitana]
MRYSLLKNYLSKEEAPKIRKELIKLALPAMGENVLQMLFGMADTAFLGHYSWKAMSGVGLSNQIFWVVQVVLIAASMGVTVTVANALGAGNRRALRTLAWNGIFLALFTGLLLTALTMFSDGLLNIFPNLEDEIRDAAKEYLKIILSGSMGFSIMAVFSAMLRGLSDTRTPMIVTGVTNLLNIFLDYAMIFGKFGFPMWGVRGAAIATVLSRFVGSAILTFVIFKKEEFQLKRGYVFPTWSVQKEILRVGFPTAIENFVFSTGVLLFANVLLMAGAEAYAGHRIGINVESLSFMPAFGISVAITTLAGRYNGMGNRDHVLGVIRQGWILSLLFQVTVGVIIFLFPEPLIRIFTSDPQIVEIAKLPVKIIGLFQFFLATEFTMNGALRGTGNTLPPMIITFISIWAVRLPVAYVMVKYFDLGLLGAWIGMISDIVFRSTLKLAFFLSGKWEKRAALTRERVKELG